MSWSPARIVLVDDGYLASLAAALRRCGQEVAVIPDFDPLVADLTRLEPSLIYFDPDRTVPPPIMLPGQQQRGAVLLMVVCASATASEVRAAAESCDGLLEWPVGAAELQRQLTEHLRRLEMVSVGVALRDAVHDLRTPLGSIKGYLSTLNAFWDQLSEPRRQETSRFAEEEVDRLTGMLAGLSALAQDLRTRGWQNGRGDATSDRTHR